MTSVKFTLDDLIRTFIIDKVTYKQSQSGLGIKVSAMIFPEFIITRRDIITSLQYKRNSNSTKMTSVTTVRHRTIPYTSTFQRFTELSSCYISVGSRKRSSVLKFSTKLIPFSQFPLIQ